MILLAKELYLKIEEKKEAFELTPQVLLDNESTPYQYKKSTTIIEARAKA
jgi:hypothetical protein